MMSMPTIWNGRLTGIGESGGQLTRPELFTMARCGQLLQWDSTSHELEDDSKQHIVSGIPDLNDSKQHIVSGIPDLNPQQCELLSLHGQLPCEVGIGWQTAIP